MKKTIKGILIIGLIALVIIFALVYPMIRGNTKEQFMSISQTENKNPKARQVRGVEYHEFLVVYRYFNKIKAGVYNDIGQPLINNKDFEEINVEDIKKEFGATAVIKNGPRFWVMDEITGYYGGEERIIGGYKMNQPGILNLSKEDLKQRSPYNVNAVNRKTTFTFKRGEKVYELLTDKNEVYTMQSGSREIDKNLTFNDLDNLGARLHLPSGWKYQVRVLDKDVTYNVNGVAYVTQDEFTNSYQKNP